MRKSILSHVRIVRIFLERNRSLVTNSAIPIEPFELFRRYESLSLLICIDQSDSRLQIIGSNILQSE